MAWVTPRTWSTSDFVDAPMMNTHVRDNLLHLHGRRGWMWVPPLASYDGATTFAASDGQLGDWAYMVRPDSAGAKSAYFSFAVPADYYSLYQARIICIPANTHTPTLAINTDYGNPDNNEAYNAHNGSISLSPSLTAGNLSVLGIYDAVPAISGGDFVGVRVNITANANGSLRMVGLYFAWNRS